MRTEIERKFLVRSDDWRAAAVSCQVLRDGLIAHFALGKVRVRIVEDQAWITLKGPRNGLARLEFEYEVPRPDAEAMLTTFSGDDIIEKRRYRVPHDGLWWEVDVYLGRLEGLIIAEVELDHPDQQIALPDWVGEEVTGDPRYRKRVLLETFAHQRPPRPA